jgi:tungstate transport system substrate-binding protein
MKKSIVILLILLLSVALIACGNGQTPMPPPAPQDNATTNGEETGAEAETVEPAPMQGSIILSTTTSTADSGLLDFLLPIFTFETGWDVRVVSVGTGAALQHGRDGNADVVLVHARALEDEFVADGYAERRYDIMYNDFIVIGPDDGGIEHNNDIGATFRAILEGELAFISRGDNSGTHVRELDIWRALDLYDERQNNPNYLETGEGMGLTINMAIEMDAFTLSDRATWYNWPERGDHVIVCEGHPDLLNPYGIMVVTTTFEPEGARTFVDWMIGSRGQELIGTFGVEEFGAPLFFPEAN